MTSAYAGTTGPPTLFPSAAFDELQKLTGDRGARAVLGDRRFSVRSVDCDAAGVDIDTPSDLVALREEPL